MMSSPLVALMDTISRPQPHASHHIPRASGDSPLSRLETSQVLSVNMGGFGRTDVVGVVRGTRAALTPGVYRRRKTGHLQEWARLLNNTQVYARSTRTCEGGTAK
jgi:hypothetical protein